MTEEVVGEMSIGKTSFMQASGVDKYVFKYIYLIWF